MTIVNEQAGMYGGGAWVTASGGRTMRVADPATGETLAELPDAGREDVWRAIDEAARAFPAWAASPAVERGRILRRIYDLMTERCDGLAGLGQRADGRQAKQELRPCIEGRAGGPSAGPGLLPAMRK